MDRVKAIGDGKRTQGQYLKILNEVYEEIHKLNTGDDEVQETCAEKLYQIVLCSERPLQIRELAAAVSVGKKYCEEPGYLLSITRSLLRTDPESGLVSFTHMSVIEFWLDRNSNDQGGRSLSKDEREKCAQVYMRTCHSLMANYCLLVLTGDRPRTKPTKQVSIHTDDDDQQDEANEFLPYTDEYWPSHMRNATKIIANEKLTDFLDTDLENLFGIFLNPDQPEHYRGWEERNRTRFQHYREWEERTRTRSQHFYIAFDPSSLFIVALWDMYELAEHVVRQGAYSRELHIKNDHGHHFLLAAAMFASPRLVRFFLETCPEYNLEHRSNNGETALHIAVRLNRKEVTDTLLYFGYCVKVQTLSGRTAVHHAADNQNQEILDLLLFEEREIRMRPGARASGNICASSPFIPSGTGEMVWKRTQDTAEILAIRAERARTALHVATASISGGFDFERKRRIISSLIEKGADRTAQDNRGLTACHIALRTPVADSGIILTLYDKRIDFSSMSSTTATTRCLVKAITAINMPETLVLSPRLGVQASRKCRNRENPQYMKLAGLQTKILHSLMAKIADPNQRGPGKGTLLHIAAIIPNAQDCIKTLLHRDAGVHAKDVRGRTPLQCAAAWGYSTNVQALLDEAVKRGVSRKRLAKNALEIAVHAQRDYDRPNDAWPWDYQSVVSFLEKQAEIKEETNDDMEATPVIQPWAFVEEDADSLYF